MKFRGGYNILPAGRPVSGVVTLPAPDVLHLPLWTRRLNFSNLAVEHGQKVLIGNILATDPGNYGVPLLAPRGGTVNLTAAPDHVTLENLHDGRPDSWMSSRADKPLRRLLASGAWGFFCDAHTGVLPDPDVAPGGIIVSTARFEPFTARGDAQIKHRIAEFVRGMGYMQSFLRYQQIHLAVPDVQTSFADELRRALRACGWVCVTPVPPRYGCEHPGILARRLGYRPSAGEVIWCVPSEGVLAVDQVLTTNRPCVSRVMTLGGPAVTEPAHFEVPIGYPVGELLRGRLTQQDNVRVINGGLLTGSVIYPSSDDEKTQVGVDPECVGLTVLPEATGPETLGWARPRLSRRSYFGCFAGNLRPRFAQVMSTALHGEVRACISCGACADVCPVGLMPYLIHKYLYQDLLDEAEAAGINLCVECGLCTYVCPSKIGLRSQFIEGKEALRSELPAEEGAE